MGVWTTAGANDRVAVKWGGGAITKVQLRRMRLSQCSHNTAYRRRCPCSPCAQRLAIGRYPGEGDIARTHFYCALSRRLLKRRLRCPDSNHAMLLPKLCGDTIDFALEELDEISCLIEPKLFANRRYRHRRMSEQPLCLKNDPGDDICFCTSPCYFACRARQRLFRAAEFTRVLGNLMACGEVRIDQSSKSIEAESNLIACAIVRRVSGLCCTHTQ